MSLIGVTPSSPWPKARTIQAAIRGTIRQVFRAEDGETFYGVRSAAPWVFVAIGQAAGVLCTRCDKAEILPPPPKATTGSGTGQVEVCSVDSREYATYILATTLFPFFRNHESCKRPEPKPVEPAPAAVTEPEQPTEAPAA